MTEVKRPIERLINHLTRCENLTSDKLIYEINQRDLDDWDRRFNEKYGIVKLKFTKEDCAIWYC